MYVVGLTGGIACGKTTVSKFFSDMGVEVIDADEIAKSVVQPGSVALKQIQNHFGESILALDQSLNRSRLRSIIFENSTERNWLENLLHPLIREEARSRIQHCSGSYCLYSAALLIEKKLRKDIDRLLVVDIPEPLQLKRVTKRDECSEAEALNILATQTSRNTRLQLADDVIDNSQSIEATQAQVIELHKQYHKYSNL